MAIGFIPKHQETYPLNGLSKEDFLAAATLAAEKLNWRVAHLSEKGLIAFTDNGIFHFNAEVKIVLQDDAAQLTSSTTGTEMVDLGRNKKIIRNFLTILEETVSAASTEELANRYETLKADFVPEEKDVLRLPAPTWSQRVNNFFAIFKPTRGFFITPILIDLNILIFLIMAIAGVSIFMPVAESLINWGANFRPLTVEGEWWRLLTCCFLHIGILHLLMNMYALLYIGVLLEPYLGKTRFLSAYLLTGIVASTASLCWHDQTISAGASGAIFGMYGVFLAMLTTTLIEKNTRKSLLTSIAIFVGYNLLSGLKGEVDNAAHIGGLLSGIVIGYVFIPSLKNKENSTLKYSTTGVLTLITLVSCFMVYRSFPNDLGQYNKRMESFVSMESMAVGALNPPDDISKEQFLSDIKDIGIYYWNENIKLIDELDRLDLTEEIHNRNAKLKKYCLLRLKMYELFYETVEDSTDKYKAQITGYNTEIEAIMQDLSGGGRNQ